MLLFLFFGKGKTIEFHFEIFKILNTAQNKSHGFTLVGDAGQNVSLGNKLKKTAELFDIISNNGDVDHPLCEECTDTLLERLVDPPKMFS